MKIDEWTKHIDLILEIKNYSACKFLNYLVLGQVQYWIKY